MIMNRTSGALLIAFFLTAASAKTVTHDDHLIGFRSASVADQRALETKFSNRISTDGPADWLRHLAARPHHVGSPYDRENAEYLKSLFDSWGFDAKIATYQVLFPVPIERSLRLVSPTKFTARLEEPPLKEDPSTRYLDEALPTYNAYSADGDVTAGLVYVNQGIPKDYEDLKRMGIDVKGKIVIARYGGSWRGIKPKVAAEHGAVGCILYSDPHDDGYFVGDPYPKGPMRSDYGAQRGSVADMPLYMGDPLTPNVAATEDAERLTVDTSPVVMKIPVLPVAYADALPLLQALEGPVAPVNWRGSLPITYHVGPGPAVVHLKLAFDWSLKPVYDVIARLDGATNPDQWIMRGNHHDGWVFGARDPISGLISLLEEARVVGSLYKEGWRPKRSIVYAAWDGEEPGLIGSTEWVEQHEAELKQHVAVYINTDSNSRGYLNAGGSHTLEAFVAELAGDVDDPETDASVSERLLAFRRMNSTDFDPSEGLSISPLGAGSDYSPFLQHSGIASLDFGFSGEAEWGAYHSVYDTYTHYERNGDPGFKYTATLADLAGRATLRLAQADLLPMAFSPLASKVDTYLTEIKDEAEEMRTGTDRTNDLIRDGVYTLTSDPTKVSVPPEVEDPVPHINFAPLENALRRLNDAAVDYDKAYQQWAERSDDESINDVNAILLHLEQDLLIEEGLPRRSWFHHMIYAPGFYTGYGVKTIPGVREAVEQRQWSEAEAQVVVAAATLDRVKDSIQRAAKLLQDG